MAHTEKEKQAKEAQQSRDIAHLQGRLLLVVTFVP